MLLGRPCDYAKHAVDSVLDSSASNVLFVYPVWRQQGTVVPNAPGYYVFLWRNMSMGHVGGGGGGGYYNIQHKIRLWQHGIGRQGGVVTQAGYLLVKLSETWFRDSCIKSFWNIKSINYCTNLIPHPMINFALTGQTDLPACGWASTYSPEHLLSIVN